MNPFRYRGYYYDTETGFYYLQSRYYNPEWGRFLNADVYVNANGDLTGYNMFAYCSNNPIMGADPEGKWTYSIGWNFSAFLVGGCTYTVSLAFDSTGNIALQTTKADVFQENSGGTFGLASIGISKSYAVTALETVDDLNGTALNVGASGNIYGPISAGLEVISPLSDPTEFVGGSVSLGAGFGSDIHATASVTETKAKINIVEVFKNTWSAVSNLFGGNR